MSTTDQWHIVTMNERPRGGGLPERTQGAAGTETLVQTLAISGRATDDCAPGSHQGWWRMTELTVPPRRGLYFLNTTPPPVLTQAALAAMDADPEGIALVAGIIERKAATK